MQSFLVCRIFRTGQCLIPRGSDTSSYGTTLKQERSVVLRIADEGGRLRDINSIHCQPPSVQAKLVMAESPDENITYIRRWDIRDDFEIAPGSCRRSFLSGYLCQRSFRLDVSYLHPRVPDTAFASPRFPDNMRVQSAQGATVAVSATLSSSEDAIETTSAECNAGECDSIMGIPAVQWHWEDPTGLSRFALWADAASGSEC